MTSFLRERLAISPYLKEGSNQPFVPQRITFLLIITLLDHLFAQLATEKYQQLSQKPQHHSYFVEPELQELGKKIDTFYLKKRVPIE